MSDGCRKSMEEVRIWDLIDSVLTIKVSLMNFISM